MADHASVLRFMKSPAISSCQKVQVWRYNLPPANMPLREWINVKVIKTLCHHASGSVVGLLFFIGMKFLIQWGLKPGTVKTILEAVDGVGIVALFILLLIQMVRHIGKDVFSDGEPPHTVLAV